VFPAPARGRAREPGGAAPEPSVEPSLGRSALASDETGTLPAREMAVNDDADLPLPALRGAVRLATEGVLGLSEVVEAVHQSVRATLLLPAGAAPQAAGGLTGLVYRGIRGVTRGVGQGAEAVLARWPVALTPAGPDGARRDAWLAALNGAFGDTLAASGNPLATAMTLRLGDRVLATSADLPRSAVRPRVVLMLHGLCMNERQWREPRRPAGRDPGAALARALDATVLHLRYNSGRPIADNGRELADRLDSMLAAWPLPLESLALVGHSMGGLVARSAVAQAQAAGLAWPARLRQLVFLGTPHHGAPLERVGHWVDRALRITPWSAPLARLGALRSAGITDLRHGSVLHDAPPPPLPQGVACYALAATLAERRGLLADRLVGDGLVPLRSALGEHERATATLDFAPRARRILYRTGHLQLMHRPEAVAQLVRWLAPRGAA
jgi:hypothetical protein